MREVEFWNWWLPSDRGGKPRRSSWKMTADEAKAYPGAARVEGTCEVRRVPESAEEHEMTGGAQRGLPKRR